MYVCLCLFNSIYVYKIPIISTIIIRHTQPETNDVNYETAIVENTAQYRYNSV